MTSGGLGNEKDGKLQHLGAGYVSRPQRGLKGRENVNKQETLGSENLGDLPQTHKSQVVEQKYRARPAQRQSSHHGPQAWGAGGIRPGEAARNPRSSSQRLRALQTCLSRPNLFSGLC